MAAHRRLALVAAAALLVAVLPSSAAAESPSDAPERTGTADFLSTVGFREDHGLRSDPAYVEKTLEDPAFSDGTFGVPLSPAEAAAVLSEVRAQDALLPAVAVARETLGFVGAYFTRDQLTISVSTGEGAMAKATAAATPDGARVVISRVPFALIDLEAARSRIEEDWEQLEAEGVNLSQVGIDPATGRVRVIVAEDRTGKALELLTSRYGQVLAVEVTPVEASLFGCNSIKDCGTKGGLAAKSGGWICSTGFLAQEPGSVSAPVRMLTAGHCIRDAGGVNGGVPWKNEQATITWGKGTHLKFDSNLDGGAFSLGSSTPTIKNEYFASGTVDIRRVRGIRTNANQIVGLTVCRSGRTSNFDCGIIRAADTSVKLGGQQFWAMWKVDMQSALGDSGAGFIDLASSMNAVGILSGGTKEGIIPWTDYTWYSSISDAEWFLNVKTCGTGRAPSC